MGGFPGFDLVQRLLLTFGLDPSLLGKFYPPNSHPGVIESSWFTHGCFVAACMPVVEVIRLCTNGYRAIRTSHTGHVTDALDIIAVILYLLIRLAYNHHTLHVGKPGVLGDYSLFRCHLPLYNEMAGRP